MLHQWLYLLSLLEKGSPIAQRNSGTALRATQTQPRLHPTWTPKCCSGTSSDFEKRKLLVYVYITPFFFSSPLWLPDFQCYHWHRPNRSDSLSESCGPSISMRSWSSSKSMLTRYTQKQKHGLVPIFYQLSNTCGQVCHPCASYTISSKLTLGYFLGQTVAQTKPPVIHHHWFKQCQIWSYDRRRECYRHIPTLIHHPPWTPAFVFILPRLPDFIAYALYRTNRNHT